MPRTTLRVSAELWARLKNRYAQTYPDHQLTFNNWLAGWLETMFEVES